MARDGFKTQVLLLHSEQSTLDSLSSGFGDSFTVHCATSGSEALNTLGDTPINVMVTAQDLPGMSGLEALREAKKRSPETIGILLAGDADEGLEALVGDKEVFQVVRGSVTSESISRLVENATQKIRIDALANSANDAAADVDVPTGQHIVMETSENGSTIISDGTGRMPALDPARLSSSATYGSHAVELLVLTKDNEFLTTINDSSRGVHAVHYANTLAQADALIREHKIGVAIVDAAMVGDKIEQLTAHLRKGSPRIVAIVAGRRDDGEMMMGLINRGKVYRFLLKPVSPGRARLAIEASVRHHLEAPDAAFRMTGAPAPSAPVGNAKAGARGKPGSRPETPHSDKVDEPGSTGKAAETSTSPEAGTRQTVDSIESEVADDPSPAVDESFTETVTGLFSTVSKRLTGSADREDPPVEAAIPAAEPHPAAASPGGSILKNPKLIGLGAAVLILIGVSFALFVGGGDESGPVAETTADGPTPAAAETLALPTAAGSGAESSAADEIVTTTETVPDPVDAGPADSEADAVVDAALADAEAALLEGRIADANAALEIVGAAEPGHSRLPFLVTQVAQLQLREHLSEARDAIRDSRFEDASTSLAAARGLELTDTTETDAVALELEDARNAQRAEDVLALANARLEDGRLLDPPNDSARYYFEQVLADDPENVTARQGLSVIASKLALNARSETDNGNLDAAEDLLVDANALDPDNGELAAAIVALADKRDEIAEQRRAAEARRRAEAERQAADARAAAEREAELEQAAAAAAEQPVADAVQSPTDEQTGSSAPAPDAAADGGSAAGAAADTEAGADAADVDEPTAADSRDVPAEPTPTAVSALTRVKYVAPKYPRSAERRNLSGWVDVIFTVDTNGLVKDIVVRDSEPGDTFVSAATKAVEKWEFEPIVENGETVEKRAAVRMMFAVE